MKRLEWIPMMPRREKGMNTDTSIIFLCAKLCFYLKHFALKLLVNESIYSIRLRC